MNKFLRILCGFLLIITALTIWQAGESVGAKWQNRELIRQNAILLQDIKDLQWQYELQVRGIYRQFYNKVDELQRALDESRQMQRELRQQLEDVWGNGGLVDFPDMKTLLYFLAEDDTNELMQAYADEEWVCADYARLLMRNAAQKGYRLYPVLIFGMQGYRVVSAHLMCFAIIQEPIAEYKVGNIAIGIEPQTDEVTIIGLLYDKNTWVDKWYKFLP